jgi:methyl-accepting chemotaxis protein
MTMTWFRNRNVMTKFLLSFGAIAAIVAVVGIHGLQQMGTIQDTLQDVYANDVVPIIKLNEVQEPALLIRIAALYHMLSKEPADMQKFATQIKDLDNTVDRKLSEYATTTLLIEEREGLVRLRELWSEYLRVRDTAVALSASGRKEESVVYAAQHASPAYRKVADALTMLREIKQKSAQEAITASGRRYASERWLTIGIVTAAVAISIGLGLLLARLMAKPLAATVAVLEGVAGGDLTRRLDLDTEDELGRTARALNRALERMQAALEEVRGGADQAAAASQQLAAASQELSSGTQEQASSLEQTAAALEQITGTVKQSADNAHQANQLAVSSRDTAEKGGQVVHAAVAAMGEINTASKKIADIITTIDEIAFQTNLLALNAAVEAARAGEQGRGFAVVAAEVRNLAQRAATAAKEIKSLIQDSVQKVADGSALVNQSGQTLEEIVTSVKRVTDIIAEIAAASQEQSLGIDQVNRAVTQMDQVVQQAAAQTEELSSTAQALSSQAAQLQALVGRFRLTDTTTLAGMAEVAPSERFGFQRALPGVKPLPPPSGREPRGLKCDTPELAPSSSDRRRMSDSHDGFEEF